MSLTVVVSTGSVYCELLLSIITMNPLLLDEVTPDSMDGTSYLLK